MNIYCWNINWMKKIEFFLDKEITHFITDKEYQNTQAYIADGLDGGPSSYQQSPVTPSTPKTPLSHPYHHLQYVNEASPSSPCLSATPSATASGTTAQATSTARINTGSEYKNKPTKPRSRADAMLQRVRQQNQNNSNNHSSASNNRLSATSARSRPDSPCSPVPPVSAAAAAPTLTTFRPDRNSQSPAQLAKSWGKPIWTTEYAIKFLNKVIETCKADPDLCALSKPSAAAKKATNLQHLRGDFVKIESFQRHYRPAFQLFKKWPWLNLNSKSSNSPFDSEREKSVPPPPSAAASNKTGKEATTTRVENSVKTTATTNATTKQQTHQQQQCGYCEICRIEYDVLANHLVAEEHSAFVNNDSNFVALDKLINDGGVGLEAFLTKNKKLVESFEAKEKEEIANSGICVDNTVKEVCGEVETKRESDRKKEYSEPEEAPKVIRTYSKKLIRAAQNPESSSPPAKRTYAGRRIAKPLSAATESTENASESQMFGRRSAIYHHPHNTLNHHNHQKVKAAKLVQQAILNNGSTAAELVKSVAKEIESQQQQKKKAPVFDAEANEMKVLNDSSTTSEKEKDRQSKRGAADRMGLKGSTLKPVSHPVELMECEGLDPKNTKRISLGLRQNPKRANLNEDFTSLLDETLGPMRKPRVRRESAKRVNYSEPREDEIASQEEIMQSILESTAKESSENDKKKSASSKRPLDVKIRGIRWRAPSPQARPPVKSPLLYKVIEEPKLKSKKTASPTKDPNATGSQSKTNKNGLIVKIRRVRQSELSLLNDEAENFMFPKKDDSSEEETDEDRQTTSETGPGDYSQEVLSSDYDRRNSSMRKSAATPAPRGKRGASVPAGSRGSPNKRTAKETNQELATTPKSASGKQRRPNRGVAGLIHDNAEYYKFPDPGSRLRFPEAPIQPAPAVEDDKNAAMSPPRGVGRKRAKKSARGITPAPSTVTSSSAEKQKQELLLGTRSSPTSPYQHQELLSNCGKNIINYVKGKEDGMGVFNWSTFSRNCKQIEPYRFAFERVPSLEPWYETFQRQDESREKMYEYFGNTAYRKLPYEMGPLPPLRQNCCILNYRMKSKTPESNVPISSASSNSSINSAVPTTASTNETTATTTTAATPAASGDILITDDDDKHSLSLPLKKRKHLIDADRPRKSPREHASTLAILSLLHQQQQHNRRRTISGCASIAMTSGHFLPPSPMYSPKKAAIQQQKQQDGDSALGDEIRSSCGSDPISEKEIPSEEPNKIKFDPPVLEDNFINYKVMCQELENFLNVDDAKLDDLLLDVTVQPQSNFVPIGLNSNQTPTKRDLLDIVQTCDKDPPLSLKMVSRHESIVRKIVQYDRKPRPLAAVSIKSFDGGGSIGFFKKRINRTGWPNAKKRIVTRKQQQQQQLLKVTKDDNGTSDEAMKKEDQTLLDGEGSRKSSTEESHASVSSGMEKLKQEEEEEEEEDDVDDDDDDDEFEDTMTMLDEEEVPSNGKVDQSDEEEVLPETPKKAEIDPPQTPEPSQIEEIIIPNRASTRPLPSSRYVTKTTTTMTRIDYNVSVSSSTIGVNVNFISNTTAPAEEPLVPNTMRSKLIANSVRGVSCPPVASVAVSGGHHDDDDKECDSISSRSIFVSDDCDTTSSTLINMCTEDPLAITRPGTPASHQNSATPQPIGTTDEPADRPISRSRVNNTRHLACRPKKRTSSECIGKSSSLQPIVCIEKLNCTSMRTRSSSRTPVKTYKRSIFTSALVNSSGIPLKRKRKKKHKMNGTSSSASGGTSSPSCSDELNSVSSSMECDEPSTTSNGNTGQGGMSPRRTGKSQPATPSPLKFSPRKLRKPRGRWYRER
ncbi:protein chiffon isoform X2 [Malaya genurostris]|uniref:protein chiffon isoform X2 n=1 Tax=Malaya genurostris TaxID=325434 RepID=UPI0026F393EA|nr:protein chiffon isoform X2 [Malaya genurostris]